MKTKILLFIFSILAFTNVQSQCCTADAYAIASSIDNDPTPTLVSVDVVTGDFTPIAPLTPDPPGFDAGGEIIDCSYYFTDGSDIYEVDLTDGTTSLVLSTSAQIAGTGNWTSLDVDPTTDILYGTTVNCGTSSSLYTIDLTAGTISLVGTTNTITCAISVVIGPTGDAFYIDIVSDAIYPIDLSTGQPTGPGLPLGFDLNFGQDYSFDCPAGTGTVYGYAFNGTTFSMQYVEIDPTNGTTTVIQDFAPDGVDQIGSFAFCVDNFVPPIPTMGEWGIISLSMLLMIFGLVAFRSRNSYPLSVK